jgi:hypothetical protein
MLDVHVVVFEAEHFHQTFQITVANFQQLVGLLSEQLDNVVAVLTNIEGDDKKFSRSAAEFNDALSVIFPDQAQIFPKSFSISRWKEGPINFHRLC